MVRVREKIRARFSPGSKERELLPGAVVLLSETKGAKVTLENAHGSQVVIPTRDFREKCEMIDG